MNDIQLIITNYQRTNDYKVELYKKGGLIPYRTQIILENLGPSVTFLDVPIGIYDARIGQVCGDTVLWSARTALTFSSVNSGCISPSAITATPATTSADFTASTPPDNVNGIHIQVYRAKLASDPVSSINADGYVFEKTYFFDTVQYPISLTGLISNRLYYVRARFQCKVDGVIESGDSIITSTMQLQYSSFSPYKSFLTL